MPKMHVQVFTVERLQTCSIVNVSSFKLFLGRIIQIGNKKKKTQKEAYRKILDSKQKHKKY